MTRKKQIILCIAAAWLLLGMVLTLSGGKTEKAGSYAAKLEAARLMQDWMENIKEMKLQAGLLEQTPSLITPGGDYDCGAEMDPELREQVLERVGGYGAPIMEEPDFEKNLSARMDIYDAEGPIQCFIGVGGNISTSGLEENTLPCGVIPAGTVHDFSDQSGLLQRYNAAGLPVIHLLNIKQLVADYGLPFDPERFLPPGESAIYYETVYPKWGAVLCLTGAVATIFFGFRRLRREGRLDGPTIYLVGGTHGDEAAGWQAAALLRQAGIEAGALYVAAPLNAYGAEHDQRKTREERDLNRNFPGSPEGCDAERIAWAVFEDIQDKQPDLVLDLHKAHPDTGIRDALGNSIVCCEVQPIGDLVLELLEQIEPLTLYGSPR